MTILTCSRRRVLAVVGVVTFGVWAGAAHGQPPAQERTQEPASPRSARRASPGAQVERRLAMLVREELGLSDAQASQLSRVSAGYARERYGLVQREQVVRRGLRAEIARGAEADDDRVARAIENMLELQRARIALIEREQRDLAAFLSPVQRAKYLVLQQQVRRRLEEARNQLGAPRQERFAPPRLRSRSQQP